MSFSNCFDFFNDFDSQSPCIVVPLDILSFYLIVDRFNWTGLTGYLIGLTGMTGLIRIDDRFNWTDNRFNWYGLT